MGSVSGCYPPAGVETEGAGRLVLRRWSWWVAGAGTEGVETAGVGWEAAVVEFRKSFVYL